MSTHCSCHYLVITSLVTKSPVAVKVKVGKRIENISRVNAAKEKMIHSDQPEFFLPIFPYTELLIWRLLAPNVAAHSYYDSLYLKIFAALSFLADLRLLSFANVL